MNGTSNANSTSAAAAAQRISDDSLATNIIINVVLAVLFFVLYLVSKHYRPKLYQLSDIKPPIYQKFGWLRPVLYGPLSSVIHTHGMDVFTYLHFLRMCFNIVVALSLFGLIVMMPINATGTNKYAQEPYFVSGTSILSMANIAPDDNLRLGFQCLAVIVNSFICCFFLYTFLRVFIKNRVKVKRHHLVQNYTVGITGYDQNKWKQERILQHFSKLFPKRIYSMHVVPDIPKLDALHERRYKLVLEKEAALIKSRKKKEQTMSVRKWKNWITKL